MAEARPKRLVVSGAQRRELIDHAATTDREVCGVIVGREDRATRVIRCRNAAEDPGALRRAEATGYVIDPLELRDIFVDCDRTGERVLAYYHSHPGHAAEGPSHTDLRDARASGEHRAALYVVVHGGEPRAFAIGDDGGPETVPLETLP